MILRLKKNLFFFLHLKKYFLPFLFCLFTICLVFFSRSNITAAKDGLSLWANSVVPSLLPFFIATHLLSYTNIPSILGKFFSKIMRPIFNVPGEGRFAFIMGIISGYPMGAKIAADLKEKGICSQEEAERLLAFTNNSGPLFIIGTVGITFFGDVRTGFLLFMTHILACISVGILFRFWKFRQKSTSFSPINKKADTNKVSLSNLGEVLASSIMNSVNTIVMIGGFVVIFSIIISMLKESHFLALFANFLKPFCENTSYSSGILSGLLELTNGIKQVASIPNKMISVNMVICSFLLGFGGISVLLQVLSITAKAKLSIKPYFFGKLLQGTLAAIYTSFLLNHFSFFNLDITPVFSHITSSNTSIDSSYFVLFGLLILSCILLRKLLKSQGRKEKS